jgi:TRAP-type C4-dicarboxylate transport system permease small subunit
METRRRARERQLSAPRVIAGQPEAAVILVLADIAKIEKSPVLGLSGSHVYWAMALGFALIALVTLCQSVRVALSGTDARFSIEHKEIRP